MKKILLSSFMLAATSMVVLTGCLKDKGFEDGEYGINDPDTQPPGVGFILGTKAKNTFGLNVSGTPQNAEGIAFINLNAGNPAASDITITLEIDSNIVKTYNTTNNAALKIMSYSLFTMPGLAGNPPRATVTLPAGQRNIDVPITVSNTLGLDPNSTYGVGVKIVAVSGNYVIADNMKNLLVEFTIKNKYDGKYNLRGYHNRPTLTNPYDEPVLMITSGPNSVNMYWPAINLYAHPLNGGVTYYGSFTTNFYFDLATNVLTQWDALPYITTLSYQVVPGSNSRYDPATKTIYANIQYNNNPQRVFFDTLTFTGPR